MTRRQISWYLAFAAIGLAAALAPTVELGSAQAGFAHVLGTWPAVPLILAAGLAGGGALAFLHTQGWGTTRPSFRGLALIAVLSALFTLPAILIDLTHPFPADMNIAPPGAFIFYPAIAFVAECLFHLLPLALLVALANHRAIPVILLAVAAIEPAYQTLAATGPAWVIAAVSVHLLAFNLFQLILFRRYGFAVMFGARLVYYLGWHILWGIYRLPLG